MNSAVKEILNGFEKRIKFINVIRRVLDYTCPKDIGLMFPDRMELDNLVIAVLLYIKERTLGNNENCKLSDIEEFIEEVTYEWFPDKLPDCKRLAAFIVVTAFQNEGEIKTYASYDSVKNAFIKMPIRLLDEEDNNYRLTDDAFDFLFRTKEIESEIDYSVTRFKMKEFIKRDNYSEALEQSRELVSRIRSMKQSMDSFIQRCRENITAITVDEYEKIIRKIRILLEEEAKELEDISKEAKRKSEQLEKAMINNVENATIDLPIAALHQVIQNIETTVEEQRGLINKRSNLSDSYKDILEANFATQSFRRMNFEKDIMQVLRTCKSDQLKNAVSFLLFPLTTPAFENIFSVENFYAIQSRLNEDKKQLGTDLEECEETKEDIVARRNERNKDICKALFAFLCDKERTDVKSFVNSLSVQDLLEFCNENVLPQAMLSLYGMGEILIENWNSENGFNMKPQGEFELAWWLKEIPTEQLNMKKIIVTKLDEVFPIRLVLGDDNCDIEMTNFELRVIR